MSVLMDFRGECQHFSLKSAGICFITAARKLIWDSKGCTHFPFLQTNKLQRRHKHNQTKVLLEGRLLCLHANTAEQKSCNNRTLCRKTSKPKCTGWQWLCGKRTGELTQPWGAPRLIVLHSEKGCYLLWHTELKQATWSRSNPAFTPGQLGQSPAPTWPWVQDKWWRKMDEWMDLPSPVTIFRSTDEASRY